MKTISATGIPNILETGKFVSVDFIKKNEQARTITGRVGVAKHTNGKGMRFNPADKGMVVIWESTKSNRRNEKDKGYRLVTLNRIVGIRANKESFAIQGRWNPTAF